MSAGTLEKQKNPKRSKKNPLLSWLQKEKSPESVNPDSSTNKPEDEEKVIVGTDVRSVPVSFGEPIKWSMNQARTDVILPESWVVYDSVEDAISDYNDRWYCLQDDSVIACLVTRQGPEVGSEAQYVQRVALDDFKKIVAEGAGCADLLWENIPDCTLAYDQDFCRFDGLLKLEEST